MLHAFWWSMFALVTVGLKTTLAQPPLVKPVVAVGKGEILKYDPFGGYSMRLRLRIQNLGNQEATIVRAETLMVCQGGWSVSQGDMVKKSNGKFFGGPGTLKPGSDDSYDFRANEPSPYTHWLMAVQVRVPGQAVYDGYCQVPYRSAGYPAPAPLNLKSPVFVGLQEPLEVMNLVDGETWLRVVGQVVNLTAKPITLKRWHFKVKQPDGKVVLDKDVEMSIESNSDTLHEFYNGFSLPRDFVRGTLRIEGEIEQDGKQVPLIREAALERVTSYMVKAPVEGVYGFGGGPGCPDFHGHLHDIASRNSYDMGVFRTIGGERVTFTGDPDNNESYFGWNQPVYCVEDGRVVVAHDTGPDGFGHKLNPAGFNQPNNCIWIAHGTDRLSCYYHIRLSSAQVKVGQKVKAGQVVGHLGNSVNAGEPHLHFGYLVLDHKLGRWQNVPVRFDGLKFEDGSPAVGIPRNGFYLCTPAKH